MHMCVEDIGGLGEGVEDGYGGGQCAEGWPRDLRLNRKFFKRQAEDTSSIEWETAGKLRRFSVLLHKMRPNTFGKK